MPTAESIAVAFAGADDEAEDMSHAPIDFDGKCWEESRLLISAELGRHAENIHELRSSAQSHFAEIGERREHDITRLTTQREADLTWIRDGFSAVRDRLTSLEVRAAIYGGVGGFIVWAAMTFFFRGH